MIQKKYKGHFVALEGTDGSGKATQVRLLQKKFQITGISHQVISFPRYNGNPYGQLLGQYLMGEFGGLNQVDSFLISLAYAGDRFLAKPIIERWLEEGFLVIADRYVASNKAHQAAKLAKDKQQNFIDWLDDLEYNVNQVPREELTIFLFVPPQIGQKNTKAKHARSYVKKGKGDIHEQNLQYLQEAGKIYLKIAEQESGWVMVDCAQDGQMKKPEVIHEQIIKILQDRGILE